MRGGLILQLDTYNLKKLILCIIGEYERHEQMFSRATDIARGETRASMEAEHMVVDRRWIGKY